MSSDPEHLDPAGGTPPAGPGTPAPTSGRGSRPGPASEPGRHPVLGFTDTMTAGLDSLASTPAWAMTPTEQAEALTALARAERRLAELRLRVLVAADRNQVGHDSGATSTPAWLAHETRTSRAKIFADLHLAQALDDRFESTRQALAAGDIDVTKARIITHAVTALTDEHDDLPAGTHAKAEAHLVELAHRFDARTLRQLGKRLFEVVCPEAADVEEGKLLAKEEARARRLAHFSVRDRGDGTSEGRFTLPSLHADILKKALEGLTSPRRIGEGRLDPETGKKLPHATLLGHGLMELVENHLSELPSVNGSPFTVVVTVPLEMLMSGLGVAGLDTGHRISAGEARRLCCKAGIIPLVLDGDSVPVDLGREQRLFDRYQKIAINHRYKGCAATNCDRPPAWVEYHHRKPWAKGGRTDTEDGIPFCPPHHHMADHPERWDMTQLPDGSYRFHRRQ